MMQRRARRFRAPPIACVLAALAVTLLLSGPAPTRTPQDPTDPADKDLVLDGSFVHDVGRLACNITNWGLIGSRPGTATTFSHAPSCRWPGPGAAEYLWAGGLWVGAVSLGERLVSTGQYDVELRPTDDPLDTIYRTAMGAPGGRRYPQPLPDDDGDGLEDEDPLNGRDDDGDGLTDEDFAAIGEQMFRCTYADTVPAPSLPDHQPLGIAVVQQTYQWSDPWLGDGIGLDFTIRNVGPVTLERVYIGFFADCDIGLRTNPAAAQDDRAGYFEGVAYPIDGAPVYVSGARMYDDDGDGGLAPGYFGVLLLDHPTDPAGLDAPVAVSARAIRIFSGQLAYDDGGDPTNDAERYEALSDAVVGPAPAVPNDYRILISSGPFASLAPGQELFYRVAILVGDGPLGLWASVAEMANLYRGAAFDRDGDPATGPDGREFVVHWLRRSDIPVPVCQGLLAAGHAPGGVRVEWQANLPAAADLVVLRQVGAHERRFEHAELGASSTDDLGVRGSFLDGEAAGWPRVYSLRLRDVGSDAPLAVATLDGPPAPAVRLDAWPNPANPRVTVRYALPAADEVRLTVHDARGRRVRLLLAGPSAPDTGSLVWDGSDDTGRPVPSGVYELRLDAGGRLARRTVTLVR